MGTLRLFDIKNYIEEYEIDTFVETGTYLGDSLDYATEFNFKELYSIELLDIFFLKCVDRFKSRKNVHLIKNNSIDGLESLLSDISQKKCLFWLDAHLPDFYDESFDSNYTKNENLFIPLKEEIKTIKKIKNIEKDIFIIDDLRIYEKGNFEHGNWDGYLKNENSVYGIKFIEDLLNTTHTISKDYRHEGYIICEPIKNKD